MTARHHGADFALSLAAMTDLVLIALVFLACVFLLYVLFEWSQDRKPNFGRRRMVPDVAESSQALRAAGPKSREDCPRI
jgi:hypothetical protein